MNISKIIKIGSKQHNATPDKNAPTSLGDSS